MAQLDWYLQINLKTRHLRLLVALDDFGNLKQVADITHVTLPAVSKALAEIEKGLGLELFKRTSKGLRPTPYGQVLVRYARSILKDIHGARDELKALSSGSQAKIHVGVFPASSSTLLPAALVLLKERSPGTNVLVTEGTANTLLPELWQGRLDLVVGRLPTLDASSNFEEKVLLEEAIRVLASRNHPLAQSKKLNWCDLQPYPWVLPPIGSLLRDPLERTLEHHGMVLSNNYIETSSVHVGRAYLSMSHAVGVMTGIVAKDPMHPLTILPLSLPRLMRPVGVLWNRNRVITPSSDLMISCLQEAAQQLARQQNNESA